MIRFRLLFTARKQFLALVRLIADKLNALFESNSYAVLISYAVFMEIISMIYPWRTLITWARLKTLEKIRWLNRKRFRSYCTLKIQTKCACQSTVKHLNYRCICIEKQAQNIQAKAINHSKMFQAKKKKINTFQFLQSLHFK